MTGKEVTDLLDGWKRLKVAAMDMTPETPTN